MMEYEIEYLAGDWVCEVGDDDYSAPRKITCADITMEDVAVGATCALIAMLALVVTVILDNPWAYLGLIMNV